MSNNKLDYRCAREISKSLTKNTNLKTLDLSQNNIGDVGIAELILPMAKK